MVRESQIPLFLWIATAIVFHLASGGGATHASAQFEETLEIGRFARSVRSHVRSTTQSLEIETGVPEPRAPEPQKTPEPPPPADPPEPEKQPERTVDERARGKSEKKLLAKPEEKKPEEKEEPKKDEKKPEEKKEEPKKKPEEKKKEEPEKLLIPAIKNRIAVRQHVEDKNQKDNPNAEFLGDHANHVDQETQARITSTDENAAKPTPGGHHSGPDQAPGNSTETHVGQKDESAGDPDRAPGAKARAPQQAVAAAPAAARAGGQRAPAPRAHVAAQQGQKAQAHVEARPQIPMTLTLPGGGFSIAEQQQAQAEQRARRARRHVQGQRGRSDPTQLLGLGARGLTENGINLNLTPSTAVAVVGKEQLDRERARDGERRLSEHRGSWNDTSLQRYQGSIENYVAQVKPGNQTALNTAHAPFASYLNTIHNRLHPVFADRFLASLSRMPDDHPLNNMEMSTNVEIVLRPEDGQVVRMGVTKSSGVSAFDIGALDSVRRAAPFGTAPKSIVSPDGNVYFHWEFHREPRYACSTYYARPYIIKAKPKSVPPELPPPRREYEDEEAPPGRRGSMDTKPPVDNRTARR